MPLEATVKSAVSDSTKKPTYWFFRITLFIASYRHENRFPFMNYETTLNSKIHIVSSVLCTRQEGKKAYSVIPS